MNLEEEFQKLIQNALDEIQDKVSKGHLSAIDGATLSRMFKERSSFVDYKNSFPPFGAETESYDEEDSYDEDRSSGWQKSSWCGDNG